MRKAVMILVIAIVVLALASWGAFFYINSGKKETISNQNAVYVNITKENFARILAGNDFVKDLPEKAVISLKIDEDYYVIRKASISKERAESYDLQISLPGEYIPGLGNLCGTLELAKSNGDFGFETSLGKTELLWKYKSMLKYRSCFGF